MKRVAIVVIIMLLLAVGCAKVEKAKPEPERINQSRFTEIECTATWRIVADRETGVMYAVSLGMYNIGNFTLLVDADGNQLIHKGAQHGTD